MKHSLVFGAFALCAAASPLAAAETANPMDAKFAAMAAVGNTFELAESRLALRHATRPELVAFARQMIADHSLAEGKLMRAAAPTGASADRQLDTAHDAMLRALRDLSGAEFDQAYERDQLDAHREAATLLSDYSQTGEDPSLRAYAETTLPKVEMHLRMIQNIGGM